MSDSEIDAGTDDWIIWDVDAHQWVRVVPRLVATAALPATESAELPESVPSPEVPAEGTREARYAEAIRGAVGSTGSRAWTEAIARFVIRVADVEHAALIERVAELEAERDEALVALASQDTYTEEGGLIVVGKLREQRARAATAEAEVRDLRAKVAAFAKDAADVQTKWLAAEARAEVAEVGRRALRDGMAALASRLEAEPFIGEVSTRTARAIRAALASVGRTESAPEVGDPPWNDWADRVANIWRDSPKTRAALTERYSGLAWALDHLAYPDEAPAPPAAPQAEGARAKVITLCGSTRFKADFESWNSRLTLDGNVVISVGVFGHGMHPYHQEKYLDPKKPMLDRLHLQKIDMADEVFIIDPGGYVGDSTKAEIAYAESLGKPVQRLSVIDPECTVCGRDNRNGTHAAAERTGHLSHAFTTDAPTPAPQAEGGEE